MNDTMDTIVGELIDYLNDNFLAEDYDSYEEMCNDIIAQKEDIAAEFMSEMDFKRTEMLKGFDIAYSQFTANFEEDDFC